jgi:hypothetical protein
MENDLFDNSNIGILPANVVALIENYFAEKIKSFTLTNKNHYGPFWHIEFSFQHIQIIIDGDYLAFGIDILIGGSKSSLWQYDRSVNNAMKTNQKNILYQLSVLERFLFR